MTSSQALNILRKANTKLVPLGGCDFDKTHFVFAMGPSKEQNEQPAWFWVDKNTGDYGAFNPGGNFSEFVNAMNTRPVKL